MFILFWESTHKTGFLEFKKLGQSSTEDLQSDSDSNFGCSNNSSFIFTQQDSLLVCEPKILSQTSWSWRWAKFQVSDTSKLNINKEHCVTGRKMQTKQNTVQTWGIIKNSAQLFKVSLA